MKKLVFFYLMLLFVTGCTLFENEEEENSPPHVDSLPSSVKPLTDSVYQTWYSNGQRKSEFYYKNGLLNGKVSYWYESGVRYCTVDYILGKKNGKAYYWHPNGILASEFNLIQNLRQGTYFEWDTSGMLQFRAEYVDDRLVQSQRWRLDGENEVTISTYQNGYLQGPESTFYQSGSLKQLSFWKQGKKDSLEKYWYENGVISLIRNWKAGAQEGVSEEYYASGNLKEKATFKENVPVDSAIAYYDDSLSTKKAQSFYVNGLREGQRKTWDADGKLATLENYQQGLKEGLSMEFWPNGNKKSEVNFIGGVEIAESRKNYDEAGNEIL